jgi:uncharacterized protein (TIGR02246 family)
MHPVEEIGHMKKQFGFCFGSGVLALLAFGLVLAQENTNTGKPGDSTQNEKRKPDEAAIRNQSAAFLRALEKGDARAVASLWTEEGEYVTDEGTTFRGRPAIEKAYAEAFGKSRGLKIDGKIESIRFLSRNTAVEEGSAKVRKGKADVAAASRYSILYARENGKWLMAVVREWPDEGTTLRDLEWLIGTWEAKTKDAEIQSTYAWDEGKKYIKARFTIKSKERSVSATQRIALDPRTGQLRSWLFENDGGFGEGTWTWDGKRWQIEATGVEADGSEMSATNLLTPLDRDSFTWLSIDRTADGEELPNTPPIKVTRVK